MTKTEELVELAREYHVDCTIDRDSAGFVVTMATGEIEHCAAFEDACGVIRAYGHREPTLTTDQIVAISEGRGSQLATTCEGDSGHGPCGSWTEYSYDNPDNPTRVYCARGHEITLSDD